AHRHRSIGIAPAVSDAALHGPADREELLRVGRHRRLDDLCDHAPLHPAGFSLALSLNSQHEPESRRRVLPAPHSFRPFALPASTSAPTLAAFVSVDSGTLLSGPGPRDFHHRRRLSDIGMVNVVQ